MPSKEEPQNFQSLYDFLAKVNLVSKYLFSVPDVILRNKIKSAERLDEVLNYVNKSRVSSPQMSIILVVL